MSLSAQEIVECFDRTRELAERLGDQILSELLADAMLLALSRYYDDRALAHHKKSDDPD